MLRVNQLVGFGGSDRFVANAVNFNGTTTYLHLNPTQNVSDNKLITYSIWFNRGAISSRMSLIEGDKFNKPTLEFETGNNIHHVHDDSGNTGRINYDTAGTFGLDGWTHILASFDLSDTGKRHIYVNDVSDSTSYNTYDNIAVDHTDGLVIGGNSGGGDLFNGDLAEVFYDNDYIDLSVAANRRKFSDSAGRPVYLGGNGSLPTGSQPLVYLSGETSVWHNNLGRGGTFTENGALTTAASSPSD